jgi:X-domain of DnaJ-containing/DnaJ domain
MTHTSWQQFSQYVLDKNSEGRRGTTATKSKFASLFPTRQPRHLVEGIGLGVRSVLIGFGMAAASFISLPIAGYVQHNATFDHQEHRKWIGLVVGGIYGTLFGSTFLFVGLLNGIYQAARGLLQTPRAVHASGHGMVWDRKKEIWKFYSLEEEMDELLSSQPFLDTDRPVKDLTYYNMLNVPSSAELKDIKQAYRREARLVHPDKNPGNETAAELFRKLHLAYLTLSDTEQRLAYDTWGFSEKYLEGGGDGALGIPLFDPHVFFTILFNAQPVEQYVGNFTLSFATTKILNFARSGGADSADDLLKFFWSSTDTSGVPSRQRKRELNIALFLNDRVKSFVNGMVSRSEFRDICRQEAQSIALGQFGLKYLYSIGTALTDASNRFLNFQGNLLGPWNRIVVWFRRKLRIVKSLWPLYGKLLEKVKQLKLQQVALSDAVLMEHVVPIMIDVVWVYNDLDIQNALSEACRRLFADSKVNSRYTRLERAEAIRILGEEFLFAARRESERLATGESVPFSEDIVSRIEAATEIAIMKVRFECDERCWPLVS